MMFPVEKTCPSLGVVYLSFCENLEIVLGRLVYLITDSRS
jgi:hypothetical protein